MKMTCRNGEKTIVGHDRLYLMAEIETGAHLPGWITLGCIGSDQNLTMESEEWEGSDPGMDEGSAGRDPTRRVEGSAQGVPDSVIHETPTTERSSEITLEFSDGYRNT